MQRAYVPWKVTTAELRGLLIDSYHFTGEVEVIIRILRRLLQEKDFPEQDFPTLQDFVEHYMQKWDYKKRSSPTKAEDDRASSEWLQSLRALNRRFEEALHNERTI